MAAGAGRANLTRAGSDGMDGGSGMLCDPCQGLSFWGYFWDFSVCFTSRFTFFSSESSIQGFPEPLLCAKHQSSYLIHGFTVFSSFLPAGGS